MRYPYASFHAYSRFGTESEIEKGFRFFLCGSTFHILLAKWYSNICLENEFTVSKKTMLHSIMAPTFIRHLLTWYIRNSQSQSLFEQVWNSDYMFKKMSEMVWLVLSNRDYIVYRRIMTYIDVILNIQCPPPGFEFRLDDKIFQGIRMFIQTQTTEDSHEYKAKILPKIIGRDWLYIRKILDFGGGQGQIATAIADMLQIPQPIQYTDIRTNDQSHKRLS